MSASFTTRREGRISYHVLASWAIFLLLGAIMWFLRYKADFSAPLLRYSQIYGPILVIAGHILIVLKAFKDSMFQGMLCLLIPFYSLYYLFAISDDFYMRAVFAGFLVGIGQDTAVVFNNWAIWFYNFITGWIAKGGGDVW